MATLEQGQFRELRRDQRLRERRGKTWTVRVAPHERDYALVEEADTSTRLRLTG